MDQSEYSRQFSLLRPALLRFARTFYKDTYSAEDIVQDTFLRGWKYLYLFTYGDLYAWLSCILRRLYFDECSKTKRRLKHARFVSYDELKENDPCFELPCKDPFTSKISDTIISAIESLPEDFKMIFKLARLEGYQREEIAKILKLHIGTVKSRLFRADQKLKDILKPYSLN